MAPTSKEATRGYFSSVSQKLESGLRQLKQRAVLDMESVKTLLAPIKQKGVNMARATREMSFLTKVEVGIAAIGVVTAMTELIHAFPYAVGLEDPKDYHPLVVPAVLGMFENMFPPVSSVEDGQVPIPTLVPVTPEGTPLSAGVFSPGTAVVEETGEVITVTPTPTQTPTETATGTPTATQTAEPTADYRDSLSLDQQTIYDAAPSQVGLEKQFLAGGLSDYLGYYDKTGEVVAVYDSNTTEVLRVLLNGENNLFLNEGPSDIVYNEELKGGLETAKTNTSLLIDYFRAKLCAKALGKAQPVTIEQIQPFMDSIAGQTCNVTLRAVSEKIPHPDAPEPKDWAYSVPRQTIVISDQTPVVIKFTDSEEVLGEKRNRRMHLNVGVPRDSDLNKLEMWVIGVGVNQKSGNSPIEITIFYKGTSRQIQSGPLAFFLHEAMFMVFDRGGYYYEPWEKINPVDELLVNYWRGGVESPLEFIRHRKPGTPTPTP